MPRESEEQLQGKKQDKDCDSEVVQAFSHDEFPAKCE